MESVVWAEDTFGSMSHSYDTTQASNLLPDPESERYITPYLVSFILIYYMLSLYLFLHSDLCPLFNYIAYSIINFVGSSNHSYNIAWNDLKAMKRKKTSEKTPPASSSPMPSDKFLQIFASSGKKRKGKDCNQESQGSEESNGLDTLTATLPTQYMPIEVSSQLHANPSSLPLHPTSVSTHHSMPHGLPQLTQPLQNTMHPTEPTIPHSIPPKHSVSQPQPILQSKQQHIPLQQSQLHPTQHPTQQPIQYPLPQLLPQPLPYRTQHPAQHVPQHSVAKPIQHTMPQSINSIPKPIPTQSVPMDELYVELTEEDLLKIEQVEKMESMGQSTDSSWVEMDAGSGVCVVSAEELELYAELERQAMQGVGEGCDNGVDPPLELVYQLQVCVGGVRYAENGSGVLLITTRAKRDGLGREEETGVVYVELLDRWSETEVQDGDIVNIISMGPEFKLTSLIVHPIPYPLPTLPLTNTAQPPIYLRLTSMAGILISH
eukprot:gene28455-34352_t